MIESISQKRYYVGLEEGKLEAAETIAKNLILIGIEDHLIIKATGLSQEKITQLRRGLL